MLKKLYFKKERKFSLPEKFDPKQDPVIGGVKNQNGINTKYQFGRVN